MTLPAGALTATLTVGAPIDIAGAAGTLVSLHVRPDVPAGLVWAADGTPIQPWSASPAAGEAPVTSASLEVLADQPGVLTSSTVDGAAEMVVIRSWPLVATWWTRQSATGAPTRHVRRFAAPAPGTTLDLDLLPADGVTVPATVTYAQTINIGAGSEAPLAHKATHATGGTDALTPADIGAQPAGSYAAEIHTQAASTISDSTAVGRSVLTAADAAAARTAIGAGTSSLVLGTTAGTAKAGDYAPDLSGYVPTSRTVAGKALTGDITLAAADLIDHTEATQDVVGAMVAAAGGTYNDAAGSITLPSGGSGRRGGSYTRANPALLTAGAVTYPALTKLTGDSDLISGGQIVIPSGAEGVWGFTAKWAAGAVQGSRMFMDLEVNGVTYRQSLVGGEDQTSVSAITAVAAGTMVRIGLYTASGTNYANNVTVVAYRIGS